jgi:hypothetical protein
VAQSDDHLVPARPALYGARVKFHEIGNTGFIRSMGLAVNTLFAGTLNCRHE